MKNLLSGVRCFFRDEEGATAVEYAILVALIAVAIVITVYAVGQQLNNVFQSIVDCLKTPSACKAPAA